MNISFSTAVALALASPTQPDLQANISPDLPRSACAATIPPLHLSDAAQAIIRDNDSRYFPTTPTGPSEWQDLQALSEEAGTRWLASQTEMGGFTLTRMELGGVPAVLIEPEDGDPSDPLVFNLHGGGYALNGGDASLYSAVSLAQIAGLASVSIDYRLIPQHPSPAALEDAIAAYLALDDISDGREIVVYGLSAGAGLGAALQLRLKALDVEQPAAVALNSPWADVAMEGDTYRTLTCLDAKLGRSDEVLEQLAAMYAGGRDPKSPDVSPLYGDWSGVTSSTLLISGTRDIFLSDTVRLHENMWDAGVDVDMLIYDGLWHAFAVDPEFTRMIEHVARFFRTAAQDENKGIEQ